MSWAEDSRRDREAGAAADLAAGMSVYDVASRRALTLADVERIRDGLPTAVWGRCHAEGCEGKSFRRGWCDRHAKYALQGLHRGASA